MHCEKNKAKQSFVKAIHKELQTELGAASECETCFFDDLTKLTKGEAKCSVHKETRCVGGKDKLEPKCCDPAWHDILFCSSSCKALSKANINQVEGLPLSLIHI